MTKKKPEENEALSTLLAARSGWMIDSIAESEEPDFLVRMSGKTIGIEVTRFSVAAGNKAHQQQGLRKGVLRKAHASYDALGGSPLQVQITFAEDPPLTKARSDDVAHDLAAFVKGSSHRQLLFGIQRSPYASTLYDGFPPEVVRICAGPVEAGRDGSWVDQQPIWYSHADAEAIARVVALKERRIESYLTRCEEVWLVIDFPNLGADVDIRIPGEDIEMQIATRFGRVFCVDPLRGRVTEIRSAAPSSTGEDSE